MRDLGLPHPGYASEVKALGDYVTEADRAAEAAIVEVLQREAPGIALLAEEAGGSWSDTMWVVDPLDGTTNFIHGFPMVGLSVALLDARRPVAGVVIGPYVGVEFTAARGQGVTWNGERVAPLAHREPSRAVVATGFPFKRKDRIAEYMAVMEGALRRFEDLRRPGAAALDLAYTACGVLDGFFELSLGTWDVAAGAALVVEAGGRVTDWTGGDGWIESGDVLAGPPGVYEVLLELATSSRGGA